FVNSLASTEAVAKAEVRLVARSNEILATRKTDDAGHVLFEAGLARGEGGLSPALLTVMSDKADYAFLSLKTNAFDLTDRGVSGRVVPAGADAFVYAERGVYRSNETVYLTALLRDGQGNAVTGGPLTLVIERPDGVEFRRAVLADQGAGGRTLAVALNSAVPTGICRVPVRRRRRGDHQQRTHADRKSARGGCQRRRDFPGQPCQAAVINASAGSPDLHPNGGSRRPRGRAQTGAAGRAGGCHDRREA